MVIGDSESRYGNATPVSANNFNVQVLAPAGGLPQAKAMLWASSSPVTLGKPGGFPVFCAGERH
jgi:hypothetical protein